MVDAEVTRSLPVCIGLYQSGHFDGNPAAIFAGLSHFSTPVPLLLDRLLHCLSIHTGPFGTQDFQSIVAEDFLSLPTVQSLGGCVPGNQPDFRIRGYNCFIHTIQHDGLVA